MPKIDGKSSTRKTVKIDGLFIGSFLMPHEDRYWKRTCVITDCDHKIGPSIEDIKAGWEPCDKDHLPAFAARRSARGFDNVGLVCPCHTAEILRAEGLAGARAGVPTPPVRLVLSGADAEPSRATRSVSVPVDGIHRERELPGDHASRRGPVRPAAQVS